MECSNERDPESECDKQLTLNYYETYDNFRKIDNASPDVEVLTMSNFSYQNKIESVIEQFPNLRSLNMTNLIHRTNDEILSILQKCKKLETFVIESVKSSVTNQDEYEDINDYKLNASFHAEFLQTIRNPNITIEFKELDYGAHKTIGIVTKDFIQWRNKLLHWIGYDAVHRLSNLNLLDLATVPDGSKVKHKQPLNLIFNYLDVNGLYAFSMVNKKCGQLIHSYNFQRCKQPSKIRTKHRSTMQRGKFMITDEFGINYNSMRLFGKSISYLEVNMLSFENRRLQDEIVKNCKSLTKLCLHTRRRIDPHNFIFSQVRHFIFYGHGLSDEYIFHCDLSILSKKCPNLEVLEIRTPVRLYTSNAKKAQTFENLQRIKFKPYDDSQDSQKAKEFFEGTATEVIVDRIVKH